MTPKRGLNYQEAIAYVGVKRGKFDELWRPRLIAMRQGVCLIFDRADLDRLFELIKLEASNSSDSASTNQTLCAQNEGRNERPKNPKGEQKWAKTRGVSTLKKTDCGKLTSASEALDFANAASKALMKRNAG